jgi:hypothetical protein
VQFELLATRPLVLFIAPFADALLEVLPFMQLVLLPALAEPGVPAIPFAPPADPALAPALVFAEPAPPWAKAAAGHTAIDAAMIRHLIFMCFLRLCTMGTPRNFYRCPARCKKARDFSAISYKLGRMRTGFFDDP